MSISIGNTRILDELATSALIIDTSQSNAIIIRSEIDDTFIKMDDYKIGQHKENDFISFNLYHNEVLLTSYSSNQLLHYPISRFLSNVEINGSLSIQSSIATQAVATCNLEIRARTGIPLLVSSNNQTVFSVDGTTCYIAGNVGIGVTTTHYKLEVADTIYVHSNLDSASMHTNQILSYNNTSGSITFNEAGILLDGNQVQINNLTLTGQTQFDQVLVNQGQINTLTSSNLQIINTSLNQNAIYIKQINSDTPPYFANTVVGNPLTIDAYFSDINNDIRIFQVDTFGRISSGKATATVPNPDYGFTYYIQEARSNYISGFMNLQTKNALEQTIINKKGYLSIGSNQAKHPLQVTNPYRGTESYYTAIPSLVGLYNNTSNAVPYLRCYNCNQAVLLTITSNGALLFNEHSVYPSDYRIENPQKSYLNYIHTNQIYSPTSINFTNGTLSNIGALYASNTVIQNVNVLSGVMSNIYISALTVASLETTLFKTIDLPNYTEFRLNPTRFLFYGSNMVLNPNPYFFEVEQRALPDDNLRIYTNGGPTRSVNGVHVIGNNLQTGIRVANCNIAVNSIAQLELEANRNSYRMGVINKNQTPGLSAEAFFTCNIDLTNDNRQLTITPIGCRVGSAATGVHILQSGRMTIGDVVDDTVNLKVKGNMKVITSLGATALSIAKDTPFVGIGTDPSALYTLSVNGAVYSSSNVYVGGNLGIGTTIPMARLHVEGGAYFRDSGVDVLTIGNGAVTACNLTVLGAFTFNNATNLLKQPYQLPPTQKTYYVSEETQNDFQVVVNGIYTGTSSNVDVFLNQSKLSYYTATLNDYTVGITTDANTTTYTITLTATPRYGDIVDITVWPQFITQPEQTGFVYQQVNMDYFARNGNNISYTAGNVGIGTTNTSRTLYVNGQIYATGDITSSSDRKYKTDLQRITGAVEKITRVNGYTFNRTDDPTGKRYMGVVAQEIQAVFPELVYQEEESLSVSYGNIVAVLIEAIKELDERVQYLEEKENNT